MKRLTVRRTAVIHRLLFSIIIEVCLLKYYFESHLIYNDAIIQKTIFTQLNIIVPYLDIIGLCYMCCNFMTNLYDAAKMSCDVIALPYQGHANYGTWSIDFDYFLNQT